MKWKTASAAPSTASTRTTRRRASGAAAALGALVAWLAPAPLRAECRIEDVARLPITDYDGLPVVDLEISGTRVPMILDMGATGTVITPATAAALKLPRDPGHQHMITALGEVAGTGRWENDVVGDIRIGGDFYRSVSIHASRILDSRTALNVGGVIGTDLLSRYDVEIDMPGAAMTLHRVAGCQADYVPWKGEHRAVAATREPGTNGRIGIPIRLMSMPMNAIIDTGAQATLVTRHAAVRAGVPDDALAAARRETSMGGTGMRVASRRFAFPSADVGGERFTDVEMTVADTTMGSIDMLLGQDWIGTRRLWISYDNATVFVSGP